MTLLIDPPPRVRAIAHSTERWPPNKLDHGGSDTIQINGSGPSFDILGHGGALPTPAQVAAVERTMFNTPPTGSFPDAYGSWVNYDWDAVVGRGLEWQFPPYVLYEFRTAAEVAAVASAHAHHLLAVTFQDPVFLDAIPGDQPPLDGNGTYNGGPYTSGDWPNQPFIRVLISEDILGDPGPFGGEQFLIECIQHETGHIVQVMLRALYGDDYLRKCTCDIFGRPEAEWDTGAWQDRVIEASAEVFKDLMLPGRKYDNRTNVPLPETRLADFEQLYVEYAETSYWSYENTIHPNYFDTGSGDFGSARHFGWFDNHASSQPFAIFARPDIAHGGSVYLPSYTDAFGRRSLHWPPEGDTLRVHWNFDWHAYGAPLDGEATAPPGRAWADMDATYEAKVQFQVSFYPVDMALQLSMDVPTAPLLAEDVWDVNPIDNPTGKGTHNITWPPGLPDEGVVVILRMGKAGAWAHPRPDAPPVDDPPLLPFEVTWRWVDDPAELAASFGGADPFWRDDGVNDVTRPWWEWAEGVRKNTFPRAFPWPYMLIPGRVSIGLAVSGIAPVDKRVIGRLA